MKFYFSETLSVDHLDGFHLLQDHVGTNYKSPWDDFGFIIKFKMYYISDNNKRKIGDIKFLAKDRDDTSAYLKEGGVAVEEKIYIINELLKIENVVSIGADIDFYKRINSIFNEKEIEEILKNICDAGYYNYNYDEFSKWSGFSGSLMRGSSSQAILKKGFQIALGRYVPKDKFEIHLSDLGDTFEPVTLRFDTGRLIGKSNISLLIGKNGVGKSHVLKKISEIITGIVDTKDSPPYFHKLIVIAFSPFESFYTKSEVFEKISNRYIDSDSKVNRKSKSRKRLHVNEYSYIGFRNEDGNYDLNSPVFHSVDSLLKVIIYDKENSWWESRSRLDVLRDTLSLCINFDFMVIFDLDGKEIEVSEDLDVDFFRKKIDYSKGIMFKNNDKLIPLSSGQKIYSYMIPAIVAEIEDESLLVLDEPELYLHPELEVGLMNMLQHILKETKSYSVIATHSAILAREIESNAITILRKNHNRTVTNIASIETFGQSLDIIISEIFDDGYMVKPFQVEVKKYLEKNDNSVDKLQNYVGDDALIYALSRVDSSIDNEEVLIEDK